MKPFLFETLLWLGRQQRAPLVFLYLTCAGTHAEVRDELARMEDEVICVRVDAGSIPSGEERAPRERIFWPPPPDLLLQIDADILYCPFGPVEFATPGIGTISTIVDVLHRDFPWTLPPQVTAERERAFQELVAAADFLQCISKHVVSRMHAHYGVPAERMFTVYIAVHQRLAHLASREAEDSGAPETGGTSFPGAPFFFYPANFWTHKNHEILLLAYGIYRGRARGAGLKPWPLLLTGHQDARCESMRALADTLGLASNNAVQFAGYVAPQDLSRLWKTAGALVFPSLHEGFGIPLLEAMEHGVPILCSRDGSLPEVGADACLFVDARRPEALAEGMLRVAGEEPLRRGLVEAGRRRLLDFSLERESAHLLSAIVELARAEPAYRPSSKGISLDGWTERLALLALPNHQAEGATMAQLTLRFHPLPASRRLRLHAGRSVALGTFSLPAHGSPQKIVVEFQPAGGALRLETLDAANLHATDTREHGVHLLAADLRLADGREYSLYSSS